MICSITLDFLNFDLLLIEDFSVRGYRNIKKRDNSHFDANYLFFAPYYLLVTASIGLSFEAHLAGKYPAATPRNTEPRTPANASHHGIKAT